MDRSHKINRIKIIQRDKKSFRQCPNCYYKYGYFEIFKRTYFRPLWKSWNCDNCGMPIRISLKRRLINAILFGIIILGLFQLRDIIESKLFYCLISVVIILISTLILTLLEKFELDKKSLKDKIKKY